MHKSRPDRTAQAPYGRTCPPVASLPSPRRLRRRPAPSAGHPCGVLPLRGSPSRQSCWPAARLLTKGAAAAAPVPAPPPRPHRAPQQLESQEKPGLARKSGLPRPCPTSNASAGVTAAGWTPRGKGGNADQADELASFATSGDDGRRRSSSHRQE